MIDFQTPLLIKAALLRATADRMSDARNRAMVRDMARQAERVASDFSAARKSRAAPRSACSKAGRLSGGDARTGSRHRTDPDSR